MMELRARKEIVMLCVECGAAMRRTDEPITDVYKNEEITVEGIPHYKCDA